MLHCLTRSQNRLKVWLYRQRIRAGREKDRAEQREKKEETEMEKKVMVLLIPGVFGIIKGDHFRGKRR